MRTRWRCFASAATRSAMGTFAAIHRTADPECLPHRGRAPSHRCIDCRSGPAGDRPPASDRSAERLARRAVSPVADTPGRPRPSDLRDNLVMVHAPAGPSTRLTGVIGRCDWRHSDGFRDTGFSGRDQLGGDGCGEQTRGCLGRRPCKRDRATTAHARRKRPAPWFPRLYGIPGERCNRRVCAKPVDTPCPARSRCECGAGAGGKGWRPQEAKAVEIAAWCN